MTLYVRDTESKFSALEDLANRTRLFLSNLNKKYRHKRIQVDREAGLVAIDDRDKSSHWKHFLQVSNMNWYCTRTSYSKYLQTL